MRTVPGSVNIHVAKFPSAPKPAADANPAEIAGALVDSFNQALLKQDYDAVSQLFVENGYWRDHLALSWVFRTLQTPPKIAEFLQSCTGSRDGFRLKKIAVDSSTSVRAPKVQPIDGNGDVVGIQFFITVETILGAGVGLARIVEQQGRFKFFTLYTRLDELRGHEWLINENRPKGVQHGPNPGRKNWAERREAASNFADGSEPSVLIVGKPHIIPIIASHVLKFLF